MSKSQSIPAEPSPVAQPPFLKGLQLNGILVTNASFLRGEALEHEPVPMLQVDGEMEVEIRASEDGRSIDALFTAHAIGKPSEEPHKDQLGFDIKATFRASYSLPGGEPLGEDERKVFHLVLVQMAPQHLWPYWREFASQVTVRMGIPPYLTPLLVRGPIFLPRKEQQAPTPAPAPLPRKRRGPRP